MVTSSLNLRLRPLSVRSSDRAFAQDAFERRGLIPQIFLNAAVDLALVEHDVFGIQMDGAALHQMADFAVIEIALPAACRLPAPVRRPMRQMLKIQVFAWLFGPAYVVPPELLTLSADGAVRNRAKCGARGGRSGRAA